MSIFDEAKKQAQLETLVDLIKKSNKDNLLFDQTTDDFYSSLAAQAGVDLSEIEDDAFGISLSSEGMELQSGYWQQSPDTFTSKLASVASVPSTMKAGTRIVFVASMQTILTYDHPPANRAEGTVVAVKTSTGNTTEYEGRVFVKWDNGDLSSVYADHFAVTGYDDTGSFRRVANSMGDLSFLFKGARTDDNAMVNKSTQDLWSCKKVGGKYVLERLFKDSGEPLKS